MLLQLALPPGRKGDAAHETAVATRIAEALAGLDTTGDAADSRSVRILAGDPELLAAFFQNVDLLFASAAPAADRVSARIMAALERVTDG